MQQNGQRRSRQYVLRFPQNTKNIPCENIITGLNTYLPKDIAVTGCIEVADDFHARYSVKSKEYVYRIYNSQIRNPFSRIMLFITDILLTLSISTKKPRHFSEAMIFQAFALLKAMLRILCAPFILSALQETGMR